jgi:hypothetical protein
MAVAVAGAVLGVLVAIAVGGGMVMMGGRFRPDHAMPAHGGALRVR